MLQKHLRSRNHADLVFEQSDLGIIVAIPPVHRELGMQGIRNRWASNTHVCKTRIKHDVLGIYLVFVANREPANGPMIHDEAVVPANLNARLGQRTSIHGVELSNADSAQQQGAHLRVVAIWFTTRVHVGHRAALRKAEAMGVHVRIETMARDEKSCANRGTMPQIALIHSCIKWCEHVHRMSSRHADSRLRCYHWSRQWLWRNGVDRSIIAQPANARAVASIARPHVRFLHANQTAKCEALGQPRFVASAHCLRGESLSPAGAGLIEQFLHDLRVVLACIEHMLVAILVLRTAVCPVAWLSVIDHVILRLWREEAG
mmetsp:Transcript_123435/g.308438  ORF Transcript_123435/g.308438 Transcript_123435/m.308438 type:complete len:317 (+) Transcript_123435:1125-2075(+)